MADAGNPKSTPPDTVELLYAAAEDRSGAVDRLLPLVYEQLRQTARKQLDAEAAGHTLTATALVHEAYLKLVGPREVPWRGRAHFYHAAAEAMRRILVDHARSRRRLKRGGGQHPVTGMSLDSIGSVADLARLDAAEEILAFDAAFRRLEEQNARFAAVVRLRFYSGLSVEQTAQALGVSPRTVNDDWAYARAWLARELKRTIGEPTDE